MELYLPMGEEKTRRLWRQGKQNSEALTKLAEANGVSPRELAEWMIERGEHVSGKIMCYIDSQKRERPQKETAAAEDEPRKDERRALREFISAPAGRPDLLPTCRRSGSARIWCRGSIRKSERETGRRQRMKRFRNDRERIAFLEDYRNEENGWYLWKEIDQPERRWWRYDLSDRALIVEEKKVTYEYPKKHITWAVMHWYIIRDWNRLFSDQVASRSVALSALKADERKAGAGNADGKE